MAHLLRNFDVPIDELEEGHKIMEIKYNLQVIIWDQVSRYSEIIFK